MIKTKYLFNACTNFELAYTKWEHFGKQEQDFFHVIDAACDLYDAVMRFLQHNKISTTGLGDK